MSQATNKVKHQSLMEKYSNGKKISKGLVKHHIKNVGRGKSSSNK